LGVARFRLDDWQVMVYHKGRIDVRRVTDVDNAADAIGQVESIVSLAFQDSVKLIGLSVHPS